ncbi:hypothetical protein DV738_g5530, partial [Chaetothyriales sp. CBS 135597]
MLSSNTFGAFIEHHHDSGGRDHRLLHQSSSPPSSPLAVPKAVHTPDNISPAPFELDQLQWGERLNGPGIDLYDMSETAATTTPRELEASQPATPTTPQHQHQHQQPAAGAAVDALVNSLTSPPRNKWRVGSSSIIFLLMGMNDAATGALIPYIEKDYNIGYAIVSLLFITYALGYVAAAPLVGMLDARLGRSRLFMLSQVFSCIAYLTLVFTPPFPAVVIAFLFQGFSFAIFLSVTNSWIVNLLNGTVLLGCCHGIYGVGGIVSPLIATAIVSHGALWSRFYLISLATAAISIPCLGWAYHGFEQEAPVQLLTVLERTASRQQQEQQGLMSTKKKPLLMKSLKDKTTLLGAIFIFFYQGSEVAISGWVISYLIQHRGGAPSQVGNVTAGFWGGITLGRFVLTPLAYKLGEKRSVLGLSIAAAVFQALVWAIPNVISNAVAVSLVGLFLGPVYPCATAVFSKLWPNDIQITGLSLVTSMGSSGGAFIPFLTGLMAQKLTTVVLHPIVLFSFAVMIISWLLLPKIQKRSD